jgi:hypothetical protein
VEQPGDSLSHLDARGRRARPRHEERELVTAEARQQVALADGRPQSRSHVAEQAVAVVVAERVVDLLEAIDVEQHERRLLPVALCGQNRLLNPVSVERPVRQPRELVVVGTAFDLLHLAPQPHRDAAQDRCERDEQQQQHRLEDADDRQERRGRRLGDRPVVLEDPDHALSARHCNRRVGAQYLPLSPARPGSRHVASDGSGRRFT